MNWAAIQSNVTTALFFADASRYLILMQVIESSFSFQTKEEERDFITP